MNTESIVLTRVSGAGRLPWRSVSEEKSLDHGDPAVHAITDFTREHPATVDVGRQIDEALNDMVRLGVRALLVAKEQRIVGLVTSYDIQGERPLQFLQSSTYSHHGDICVADIMTPWDELLAVDWQTLQFSTAGDLLHVFEETGLTHLIVVEHATADSTSVVRALVSRSRLFRQLNGARRTA